MRRCLTHVSAVALLSFSVPALAQDKPNCPPGSWFCAEAEVQVTPPAPQTPAPPPSVTPSEPTAAPPVPPPPPRVVQPPPPPVVVYPPPPPGSGPQVIVVTPGWGYGYAPAPPPLPRPRVRPVPQWTPEWGLNFRFEGVPLGHASDSRRYHYDGGGHGLGGVGLSFRYRPVPGFAFDFGADILGGTDYNGFTRTETPVSLGGLIYLNPRSRVQVYLEGGINYSHAEVRSSTSSSLLWFRDGNSYGASYDYFGGQGGGGLELRLSQHFAMNFDVVGFVRSRVGDVTIPEYVDASGNTTNTSGGAILRGGITFWW